MTNEEKQKMLLSLFPNEDVRKFMCNDLFQEIKKIVPISLIISQTNKDVKQRELNYITARDSIKKFILNDKIYNDYIFKIYELRDFESLVDNVFEGYVFYLTCVSPRHTKIDMFKDSRSVFCGRTSNFNIF